MLPDAHWEQIAISDPSIVSYQLNIVLKEAQSVTVGRLGRFELPDGNYIYTGSARRNLVARVKRHLRKDKSLRWHIDYLLALKGAQVMDVQLSDQSECEWNKCTQGEIIVPGFGASDCKSACSSHLKYLGKEIQGVDQ
jgi:Uri superfamily endonuclease